MHFAHDRAELDISFASGKSRARDSRVR